jgi:hypothetical protein
MTVGDEATADDVPLLFAPLPPPPFFLFDFRGCFFFPIAMIYQAKNSGDKRILRTNSVYSSF